VTAGVAVVGAGIVGLAVGRRLAQLRPGVPVTVFEKEQRVGAHQTGHNSGVVHAGVYYPPGSLKARLCRRGGDLLWEYCGARGIAVHHIGKVVVARDRGEVAPLERLWERASANGVPGLTRLGPAGLADLEPHVNGVAALHSPRSAVVDFAAVAATLAAEVAGAGGDVRLGTPVAAVRRSAAGGWLVEVAGAGADRFDAVVVCAGLTAEGIRGLPRQTAAEAVRIVPFRGHYYRLGPRAGGLVNGLVYPVPDPRYPFLGIHVTPTVGGEVLVGPNAVLALAPEGYRFGDVDATAMARLAMWPGVWRLAARHWRTGVHEVRTAASRRAFAAAVRRYLPAVADDDLLPAPSGVRAQAVSRRGDLVDDFVVDADHGLVVVRNAPSPAATSALAIAEHITALMGWG
jgi:L-2-hydroxyglutarate oxidase